MNKREGLSKLDFEKFSNSNSDILNLRNLMIERHEVLDIIKVNQEDYQFVDDLEPICIQSSEEDSQLAFESDGDDTEKQISSDRQISKDSQISSDSEDRDKQIEIV